MIDTHCHIDDEQYQADLPSFIRLQQEGGVQAMIVPGVNVASIEPVRRVCEQFPGYLYPAIGLHPEEVKEDYQSQLDILHQALITQNSSLSPYIAVGEIGLDYHFDTTYMTEQQDALRQQLQWAINLDLPVLIHSRDATEHTLTMLSEYPACRGIMHCFSGSNEVAKQVVKMGLYLGIGGVITFKNCKLRFNLTDIPLQRIVLETDAPYMAPVPFRGQPNQSRWMNYVVDVLAEVYHSSPEHVIEVTTENAKTIFGLKV